MHDIKKIHEEVLDFLLEQRKNDPLLFFTLRKSNREGRLEKGYWFYGNEWYIAISFWTGIDWKNKTPNIIFVILADSGKTYLEINTSDSDEKRRFISEFVVSPIGMEVSGKRYRKYYESFNGNYLESLKAFLYSDKQVIDDIIRNNSLSFFKTKSDTIFFLEMTDFLEQLDKINIYRSKQEQKQNNSSIEETQTPTRLNSILIENYGPIKKLSILDIPFSSQWLFFTGENGTGKTSLLRAISTSLCFRKANLSEFTDKTFKTDLTLFLSEKETITYQRIQNNIPEKLSPIISGFAAYGQSRLKTGKLSKENGNKADDLTSSLFEEDSILIDLQSQFDEWKNHNEIALGKREGYITEILTDIIPNLYNIVFDDIIDNVRTTSYVEKDNDGTVYRKVTFDKLASGLKNMIAMIGDILVRLYSQQPDIIDPAEFTGLILIDEIDIHLHPKLQKQLVEQLSKTFPKVQFIVTTHSPIPLLGAPKNSQIFRVYRDSQNDVQVRKLNELLELGDLLPNTILTSPIFGLDNIVPSSHDSENFVRTEVTFSDLVFNDIVSKKIDDFLTDAKEQQLIGLFKQRRT